MNKTDLLEILQDWNFWNKELDTGVQREEYVEKCLAFAKTKVVVVITGLRRSGKSYIMRQAIRRLLKTGTLRKNVLMVNFEDKRFTDFTPGLLDEVYGTYVEFLKPDEPPFVFLDEIQNVPQWERWARTMNELEKARIIVSGSSAKLLASELATLLTGRHLDVFVTPLSFGEFLKFKGITADSALEVIARKNEIGGAFREYAEFGGFPEVVLSGEKKELLLTYFDDILTKDIERRYKVRESAKLRALTRFYLTNSANAITFNSLRKFLDTTTHTIEKFSAYLEEANLLFFVKRFSFKVKEQEKAARKVYSRDTGLSNAVGLKFGPDSGRVAENIVAAELNRRERAQRDSEVYYWQDPQKKEVDFVIKKGLNPVQLIQVCWNIYTYKTKEGETKALLKASRELKCDNLVVITEDHEAQEKVEGKEISFIPLWKWLLQQASGASPA